MAKLSILAGATSQSVTIFIQNSSVTTGAGLTGLAPAGGALAAGLICYYTFAGTNTLATAVTLSVPATVGAAYASGQIVEIDATHMPGLYRLDLPNAALATAKGRSVVVYLSGATNMAPCLLEIELTGWDNQLGDSVGRVNVGQLLSQAVQLDANNLLKTDLEDVGGTVLSTHAAGMIPADLRDIVGAAVSTGTAQLGVNVVTNGDKTGYSLASLDSAVLHSGTAQAGAAGTITLAAGASATNNLYNGLVIAIYGGTGSGQARVVTAYNGTTKVATVDNNWTTNPDATSLYRIVGFEHPKLDASQQVTAASVQGNVTGSVASVTAGVTVTTNNDKTGYSLTQSFPTNFAAMAITVGGAVTVGTNNDKSGYSLTQAFPTNFATLAIDASGRVTIAPSQIAVKKNQALNAFAFLLVSSTDHVSAKTGATVTATRSIDGGAFAACANAVTEIGAGIYVINLAATDLNGNVITLQFAATGADTRFVTLVTQA